MKLLDLTLPTPAENLACDEALLDSCEARENEEVLRFWESPEPFVVVGYANKVATEVNEEACQARDIPILRRCTGGGTVVQGPGCLNYALVLQIIPDGPTRNVSAANRFIMEHNRDAIQSAIGNLPRRCASTAGRHSALRVEGHTDLTMDGLKFSGNSQRRRKHLLLFHGTFLLNFDLKLIDELLRMPTKQPDYRASRSHGEFVTNLNLPAEGVKAALQKSWSTVSEFQGELQSDIARLVKQKYSQPKWNRKL